MKNILFLLLFSCISTVSSVYAQEHRTIGARCKFYVPNAGGATPDAHTGCPVCDKEREDEYNREAAAIREQQRQREEKIAQENERYKEKQRAEKRDWENRNAVALNKLQNLSRENESYDRLRREEVQKKEAIRKRYEEQVEKSNREYNDFLSNLQKNASTAPVSSTDSFWKETVSVANYIPFSKVVDRREVFGFKDRNGRVKIGPKYNRVSNFSGGITFVELETRDGYKFRLINSREETVIDFDKSFLNKMSRSAGKEIVRWNFPDTISEGMVILKLESRTNNKNAFGALDKKGDLAVPPVFYKIEGFKNGVSIASKLIDEEEYTFENFPNNYYGDFYFLEVGLIDKRGNWIEAPKRKMEYRYYSSPIGYLTISDINERLTAAEKKYQEEQWELTKKKRYAESMKRLEEEVRLRVSQAQADGYLIENLNTD